VREADRLGFVVAFPEGIHRGWNDGREGPALRDRTSVDDVGFLASLSGASPLVALPRASKR
jgi:polyhydroxybutyrate depolymerase